MLGDDIAQALPGLRAQSESLMVDTCIITKDGEGESALDPDTDERIDPPRVAVYEGKCRIQVASIIAGSSTSEAGERAWVVQDATLQLPVPDTEVVAIGHIAEITTCVNDDALVGHKLTVTALHTKTHATSRRLRVTEATR